jgi:hypothetical protein
MKSWQLEKTGRENLHFIDIPEPTPGPDEILVRTTAISLNFRDKAIIEGLYPRPLSFPLVPGGELAGEVVAVGANVRRFKPSDKVVSVYKPLWIDGVPTLEASGATRGAPLPGVLEEYILLSEDGNRLCGVRCGDHFPVFRARSIREASGPFGRIAQTHERSSCLHGKAEDPTCHRCDLRLQRSPRGIGSSGPRTVRQNSRGTAVIHIPAIAQQWL